ncbi:MAG: hypothetical protein KBC36_00050 [Spirochaetia bacterium]|nr:hypothetical protein [Spirochaetia bacterium]
MDTDTPGTEATGSATRARRPSRGPRRGGDGFAKAARRLRRTLLVVLVSALAGLAAGFGIVALANADRAAKVEDVAVFVAGTAEAGKLVLAETRGVWEGTRRVPAAVLGIRSDWQARFRAGYLVRWYVDFLEDGPPRVSYADHVALVEVPRLRADRAEFLPETFAVLSEDRSMLVDEERAKMELVRGIGAELAAVVPHLDTGASPRATAMASLARLVRDAFVAAGFRVDHVSVRFAD